MRKTTDSGEHKYLIDREFNTFGRGAIEDAPAELLYGHSAVAKAFNVNCYNQYFEGRSGSRLYATPARRNTSAHNYPAVARLYTTKDGYGVNLGNYPEMSSRPRYIHWQNGARDVIRAFPAGYATDVLVESDVKNEYIGDDGEYVSDNVELRNRPSLMTWHSLLKMWVRVESGHLSVAPFDFMWLAHNTGGNTNGWSTVFSCEEPFGDGRMSFIEYNTGGVLYTVDGIYKLVYEDGGLIEEEIDTSYFEQRSIASGVIFRINIGAPAVMATRYQWNPSELLKPAPPSVWRGHVYRYLFTGTRIRGVSRLEGGIFDFETPTSDHNFNENGLFNNYGIVVKAPEGTEETQPELYPNVHFPVRETSGAVGKGSPNWLTIRGGDWADDIGAVTHLSVYRTRDLEALDPADETRTAFNSPNAFTLVDDIPLLLSLLGTITRDTDNDIDGMGDAYHLTLSDDAGSGQLRAHDLYRTIKIRPRDTNELDKSRSIFRIIAVHNTKNAALEMVEHDGDPWSEAEGAVVSAAAGVALVVYITGAGAVVVNETTKYSMTDEERTAARSMVGKPMYLSNGNAYTVRYTNISDDPQRTSVISTSAKVGAPGGYYALASLPDLQNFDFDFADTIDDVDLRARQTDWYPRTRFRRPMPNCNIAAKAEGVVLCAVEGGNKIYHTDDDITNGSTVGSHNPVQMNSQVNDRIRHIEVFSDVVAIFGDSSTWNYPLGLLSWAEEFGGSIAGYSTIPRIGCVDAVIGCKAWRSMRHTSIGEVILITNEAETAGIRTFNGHSYGPTLIEDTALGMLRNACNMREIEHAVAIYGEDMGYMVWAALTIPQRDLWPHNDMGWQADLATTSTYCFRLAVRPHQGGGITEYGGEHWLWPDADAATVAKGRTPTGDRIILVEDARTGDFFEIGIAELWMDREVRRPITGSTEYEITGHEIETRVALPIIADGYKWQKHLETHIAMRCWKPEYRGAEGFTADGFKPNHKISLKIFEDGEQIAEASALQDINRNGDFAYLKKVEARRIQEVIETTTSAYKISHVVAKVQTSDREALPVDNEPLEVVHQREWRTAAIHLSRNLPYTEYNRADGVEMGVILSSHDHGPQPAPGRIEHVTAPTGKPHEAFCVETGLTKTVTPDEDGGIVDITVSMWVRPRGAGNLIKFSAGDGDGEGAHDFILSIVEAEALEGDYPVWRPFVHCTYDGSEILRWPLSPGVWQHVALRRKVNGPAELISLYVNGINVINSSIARVVQGGMWTVTVDTATADDFVPETDAGTFGEGISYQNTWQEVGGSIYVGRDVTIGQGRSTDYYDVRLMLSAVSGASIKTYYDAVGRGGEGWLP